MINNLTLVGRVGADPEIRHFASGSMVASLRVAVNRPTKEKETDWFEVKVWGKQAEIVSNYVRKGHLVGIIGRLEEEKWEKDGQKRSKVIVNGSQVRLMEPKSNGNGGSSGGGSVNDNIFGDDDEIPF